MTLSTEQLKELQKPIDPVRVKKDAHKGFSYLEAWDVRRTMNRIFGFGRWSADVRAMELVSEREVTQRNGKPGWNVVYRAQCVLTSGTAFEDGFSYTEWAAGDSTNPVLFEAHDQAIKTAASQAFKRCAMNLGDQFGLSLYNDGSTEATVDEVVGQEYADAQKVEGLLELFSQISDEEGLARIAKEIPTLDISPRDIETLREAYKTAKGRL